MAESASSGHVWPKFSKVASKNPGYCKSCFQWYTDDEKDLEATTDSDAADRKVVWHHWKGNVKPPNPNAVAVATECYKCYDVRRSPSFKGLSQEALCDKREADDSVNQKFCQLRHQKVNGVKAYTCGARWNAENATKAKVLQSNENFGEQFEEVLFVPLTTLLRRAEVKSRMPRPLTTLEEKMHFVTQVLKETIVRDANGVLGIEEAEHEEGCYKIRRGKRTEQAQVLDPG